ncbi:MAG: hypothetical protein ABI684_09635, partial [Nitrospirota bacterium]
RPSSLRGCGGVAAGDSIVLTPLDFHTITARPVKTAEIITVHQTRRPLKPMRDHPWRKRLRPEREQHPAAAIT